MPCHRNSIISHTALFIDNAIATADNDLTAFASLNRPCLRRSAFTSLLLEVFDLAVPQTVGCIVSSKKNPTPTSILSYWVLAAVLRTNRFDREWWGRAANFSMTFGRSSCCPARQGCNDKQGQAAHLPGPKSAGGSCECSLLSSDQSTFPSLSTHRPISKDR